MVKDKNIRYGARRSKIRKQESGFFDKLIRRTVASSIIFFVCLPISGTKTYIKNFISKTLTVSSDTDVLKEEFNNLLTLLEKKYANLKTDVLQNSSDPEIQENSAENAPPESEVTAAKTSDLIVKAAEEFTYPENINMIIPLNGKVTSPFGGREHPIYGNDSSHQGVDIAGNTGEAIVTTAPGKVIEVKSDDIHGNYVRVKHTERIETFYAHMNTVSVKEGDILAETSVIGTVGSTGLSTGPHLHFGVYVDGASVDPEKYIKMEHK